MPSARSWDQHTTHSRATLVIICQIVARRRDQPKQLGRAQRAGPKRVERIGEARGRCGKFGLRATCSGAGCAPVVEDACLLGATYGDFRDSEQFTTTSADASTWCSGVPSRRQPRTRKPSERLVVPSSTATSSTTTRSPGFTPIYNRCARKAAT